MKHKNPYKLLANIFINTFIICENYPLEDAKNKIPLRSLETDLEKHYDKVYKTKSNYVSEMSLTLLCLGTFIFVLKLSLLVSFMLTYFIVCFVTDIKFILPKILFKVFKNDEIQLNARLSRNFELIDIYYTKNCDNNYTLVIDSKKDKSEENGKGYRHRYFVANSNTLYYFIYCYNKDLYDLNNMYKKTVRRDIFSYISYYDNVTKKYRF